MPLKRSVKLQEFHEKKMGQTKLFVLSSPLKNRKDQMTRTKDHAKERINKEDLQQFLAEDQDLLKVIVEQSVQRVLEAEREEALQAGKSERRKPVWATEPAIIAVP